MVALLTLLHMLFQLWQGKKSYASPWEQMGIVQRAKTLEKPLNIRVCLAVVSLGNAFKGIFG